MTPKERIITAMKNQQPDMVPVTLGLSEMVPVRKSGLSYIDFFWHDRRSLVQARYDTEKFYGADVFLHSAEGPSPADPEISQTVERESAEELTFRSTIHTALGDLSSLQRYTRTESLATLEGFVKDPERDAPRVLELLRNPESKDFSGYLAD